MVMVRKGQVMEEERIEEKVQWKDVIELFLKVLRSKKLMEKRKLCSFARIISSHLHNYIKLWPKFYQKNMMWTLLFTKTQMVFSKNLHYLIQLSYQIVLETESIKTISEYMKVIDICMIYNF
uniref:Uncharacterized protein n=1 Tax=Meloidogyne enterolobii TaxID=390850 RepID=A0A6V7VI15_MELEN|nr:unnamed protein product [Meloidogyne enterolobii]